MCVLTPYICDGSRLLFMYTLTAVIIKPEFLDCTLSNTIFRYAPALYYSFSDFVSIEYIKIVSAGLLPPYNRYDALYAYI